MSVSKYFIADIQPMRMFFGERFIRNFIRKSTFNNFDYNKFADFDMNLFYISTKIYFPYFSSRISQKGINKNVVPRSKFEYSSRIKKWLSNEISECSK